MAPNDSKESIHGCIVFAAGSRWQPVSPTRSGTTSSFGKQSDRKVQPQASDWLQVNTHNASRLNSFTHIWVNKVAREVSASGVFRVRLVASASAGNSLVGKYLFRVALQKFFSCSGIGIINEQTFVFHHWKAVPHPVRVSRPHLRTVFCRSAPRPPALPRRPRRRKGGVEFGVSGGFQERRLV